MRIAIIGNMDVEANDAIEIRRYEISAFCPNAKIDGYFDKIYVSNSLPELGRDEVMKFFDKALEVLVDEGELVVQVPMAEYACRQIFMNKADMVTYYMLYGNDDRPFKACYTMMQLRTLLARAGFNIREATEAFLKLTTVSGEGIDLPVHSVVAFKPKGIGDDNSV